MLEKIWRQQYPKQTRHYKDLIGKKRLVELLETLPSVFLIPVLGFPNKLSDCFINVSFPENHSYYKFHKQ